MEVCSMMRKFSMILLIAGLAACANVSDDMEERLSPDERPSKVLPEYDEGADNQEEVSKKTSVQEILEEVKSEVESDFLVKLPSVIMIADEKYLTVTVDVDALYYEVAYFETDYVTEINDAVLMQKEPLMLVKGRAYDSIEEAQEQVGYQPTQRGMPEVDLGDDIIGYQDAGAGSSFITWHEGRWSFMMRSRNDESGAEAGKELAREIVDKLSKQLLPPPNENGAGLFNASEGNEVETNRLAWQEGHIVYEVYMADAFQLVDVVMNDFKGEKNDL